MNKKEIAQRLKLLEGRIDSAELTKIRVDVRIYELKERVRELEHTLEAIMIHLDVEVEEYETRYYVTKKKN